MSLTILKRRNEFYRPYGFENKFLDKIVFFNKDGIVFETTTGWLEDNSLDNEIRDISGKDVEYLEIETPKLKRKIDFKSKFNFYTTHKEKYGNDTRVCMYILCNDENSIVSVKKISSEIVERSICRGTKTITHRATEYVVTGISNKVIHTTTKEVVKCELTEIGEKAQKLKEKHEKNYELNSIDELTWASILRIYELKEKK